MAPAKKENLLLSSSFPSVNTPERFQKSKPAPCAAPKDVKVSPAISQRNVDIVDQKLSSSIPKERPDEIFRWKFFFPRGCYIWNDCHSYSGNPINLALGPCVTTAFLRRHQL